MSDDSHYHDSNSPLPYVAWVNEILEDRPKPLEVIRAKKKHCLITDSEKQEIAIKSWSKGRKFKRFGNWPKKNLVR